jgi:hypothetical protein
VVVRVALKIVSVVVAGTAVAEVLAEYVLLLITPAVLEL